MREQEAAGVPQTIRVYGFTNLGEPAVVSEIEVCAYNLAVKGVASDRDPDNAKDHEIQEA